MKKGMGFIIISIFIMLIAVSVSVYAWFGLIEKTQPIIIYSGTVELEAHLYDSEDNEIEEITITNVIPGDVYNFKLKIKNLGTIPSNLTVDFSFLTNNNNLKDFVSFHLEEDSTNFNSSNYLYTHPEYVTMYNPNKSNEVVIEFSVKFSEDLELSHLENLDNTTEITKIEITLKQA